MDLLLWVILGLLGLFWAGWVFNKVPLRQTQLAGLLSVVLVLGGGLSFIGIWQAVPATVVALIWLVALLLVRKFGREEVNRPYSGVLFALFLVIVIVPVYSAPVRDLPSTDGTYAVGMKEFVVVDPSRPGLRGEPADAE